MSIDKKTLDALPSGKTCGDCAHYARCVFLFGCKRDTKTCDWVPSRFLAARPNDAEPSP